MPIIIRSESDESVATNSSLTAIVTVLVLFAVFALGYFAWWVPSQAATPLVIEHQTTVHDQAAPSTTTIVTPAPQQPVIIQGAPGPKGDTGPKGDPPQNTGPDAPGNIGDNAPVSTGR